MLSEKKTYLDPDAATKLAVRKVDFLIVGQGLCGTILSRYLLQAGKTLIVLDDNRADAASRIASGVINPVTGRRIVQTWRIEELLPFAWSFYIEFGHDLGCELVRQCNILDFYPTSQMKEAWESRVAEGSQYLKTVADKEGWKQYFHFSHGIGEITPCLLVDLNEMITRWRENLKLALNIVEETFSWEHFQASEHDIKYKNISAQAIIFCEGVSDFDNPFFKNLPWAPMKGEALIASMPCLPRSNIYKQGMSIVPWKENSFWVGSSYEWRFKSTQPTPEWRCKAEEFLKNWLKIPFEITGHLASVRPANLERRPFVGMHPRYANIGILNGMGAKGCSIAPFFAKQLTEFLLNGTSIYADADVKRFTKTLAR